MMRHRPARRLRAPQRIWLQPAPNVAARRERRDGLLLLAVFCLLLTAGVLVLALLERTVS